MQIKHYEEASNVNLPKTYKQNVCEYNNENKKKSK